MHILFLTDNFPPEGNAPATRTYEHAREWVKLGHKVTIITCAPNFPEGKLFEGYENKWYQKSKIEEIEVRRVKTYITANEGFLKRTLDYTSFMISGFIAGLFVRRVDVVVSTSPQFFTAIAGFFLSRVKRRPFVFELRDIWPASITAVGAMRKSKVISLLEKLELFLYRKASLIISVTESFKQELCSRGIDAQKISVIRNGVDLSHYLPAEKDHEFAEKYQLHGKFVVGYIGTHGLAHGLENVVAAANLLKDHEDIVFLFAGGGATSQIVLDKVKQLGLKNVVFLGRQDKVLMPKIWSLCDISLIPLKNTPLFETVIPSKIFESMAMGLPLIMSMPEGEAVNLVLEGKAGVAVTPESADAIASKTLELFENLALTQSMSRNAVHHAKLFDRKQLAEKMLKLLVCLNDK